MGPGQVKYRSLADHGVSALSIALSLEIRSIEEWQNISVSVVYAREGIGRDEHLHSMSQHYISTKQFEALVGWDRPLQYFFGQKSKKNTDDGIVFATLHLPEGGVGTAAELAKLLAPYIELPDDIRETLLEDQMLNRGNAVYRWDLEDTQNLP